MQVLKIDYRTAIANKPSSSFDIVWLIICSVLTPITIAICTTILFLDAQSGHVLPLMLRGEMTRPVSPAQSEVSWRKLQSDLTGDQTWTTRSLNPKESTEMQADVKRNVARRELRDFMDIAVLQYVFTPILLVSSILLLRCAKSRRHWTIGVVSFFASAVCGYLMYFPE